jgi:hypothetical protein
MPKLGRFPPFGKRFFRRARKLIGCCHFAHFLAGGRVAGSHAGATEHAEILDFIFVARPAQQWQAKSWVVVRPGDFPDSDETSDHRPVAGVVELHAGQ